MSKVLVTGGSGFIGTNLVESLLRLGHEVRSIDIEPPQCEAHETLYARVDIRDPEGLRRVFDGFAPSWVIHLAARTDLNERRDIRGYAANMEGVENLLLAVAAQPSVRRCVFASSKLVLPTDGIPESDDDYRPNTLYGRSKMEGEIIVRNRNLLACEWCIVRPTSIWGPWAMKPHIPYGKFFQMVARGLYFHPGKADPQKSFGFVGNTAFQIRKLLEAPREAVHGRVFYLSDYEVFTIRSWADLISLKVTGRRVRTMPEPLVRLLSRVGDLSRFLGISDPMFSTFRLRNMRADTTGIPLEPIRRITGPLPFTLEKGVDETIAWMKDNGFIGRESRPA